MSLILRHSAPVSAVIILHRNAPVLLFFTLLDGHVVDYLANYLYNNY